MLGVLPRLFIAISRQCLDELAEPIGEGLQLKLQNEVAGGHDLVLLSLFLVLGEFVNLTVHLLLQDG